MVETIWLYIHYQIDSSNRCIHGSDPELIFLTDGASKGVMQILNTIIRGPSDGVMFLDAQLSTLYCYCLDFSSKPLSSPSFRFTGVGCSALLSISCPIRCLLCFQILVPVPQYPLYSATIALLGGSLVPYYLEETANWGLDIVNLRQSVATARSQGLTVSISLLFLLNVYPKSFCKQLLPINPIILHTHLK